MYSVLAQKIQLLIYAVFIKIHFPLASQNVTEIWGMPDIKEKNHINRDQR
jgi:hypothetical protein